MTDAPAGATSAASRPSDTGRPGWTKLCTSWNRAGPRHVLPFAIEVLVCPRCAGPCRIVGAVTESHAVWRLPAALGLTPEPSSDTGLATGSQPGRYRSGRPPRGPSLRRQRWPPRPVGGPEAAPLGGRVPTRVRGTPVEVAPDDHRHGTLISSSLPSSSPCSMRTNNIGVWSSLATSKPRSGSWTYPPRSVPRRAVFWSFA